MGPIFEEICKQWLWRKNKKNELPLLFSRLGRWWGNDPRNKCETEIDIVANNNDNEFLFCECKWSKNLIDFDVVETLQNRSSLLSSTNSYYYIFSRSGFTEQCRERAEHLPNVRLIDFNEMCSTVTAIEHI